MNYILTAALIVCGLAYVAWSANVMVQFSSYCDRVAKLTGREGERSSQKNIDEGGLNAFQREQFWRVMRGDQRGLSDREVVAQGERLTRSFWLGYLLGAALLFAIVLKVGP